VLLLQRQCDKRGNAEATIAALTDTLHVTTDKFGKQTGSILALRDKVVTQDSTITWLNTLVTKQTNTGTVAGTTTYIYDTAIIRKDSIILMDGSVFLGYSSQFTDKWWDIEVAFNDTTSILSGYVMNEFETWSEWKRTKWHKRKELTAYWRNLNPHTKITELRSYTAPKERYKPFSVGASVGYGVSIPDFVPSVYIGAGVQITLFRF